jgi:hypothetical protein
METNELITKETLERNGFVFVEEYGMMRWMEDLGSRNGGFEVCWTEDLNLLQIRGKGVNLDFFGCSYLQQMQNIMKDLGINKEITQ